jgi:hypothetical protein
MRGEETIHYPDDAEFGPARLFRDENGERIAS